MKRRRLFPDPPEGPTVVCVGGPHDGSPIRSSDGVRADLAAGRECVAVLRSWFGEWHLYRITPTDPHRAHWAGIDPDTNPTREETP